MSRFTSLALASVSFAIYVALCPHVSGPGDGSEFTLVLATNGVAHPTGYPLYTLFGHIFCRLLHSFGLGWPFAANVWSAVGAAVAVYFLHALGSRLTGDRAEVRPWTRALAPLLPVSLFAFQPVLLLDASVAEVNSWSAAWACGAGYLFVRLLDGLAPNGEHARPGLVRGATAWGLVCGIGLAHHLVSVFVTVPLTMGLGLALWRQRCLKPSLLFTAFAASLIPVASYGIIAWKAWHPSGFVWNALSPGWTSVFQHITGEQYRSFLGRFSPAPDQRYLLARIGYPFLFSGIALLLVGAIRAGVAERRIAWWTLLASALCVTMFTFRYGVPDPAPYFLPAIAFGAAAAAPFLATLFAARALNSAVRLGGAILATLAILWLSASWIRDGYVASRAVTVYEEMIRSMWSAVPPGPSILFWHDDRFSMLLEYQILGGEKPAVFVTNPEVVVGDLPREQFHARFGFDPLEGLTVPAIQPGSPDATRIRMTFFGRVIRNINDRSPLPVILFLPSVPMVRQLDKPGH